MRCAKQIGMHSRGLLAISLIAFTACLGTIGDGNDDVHSDDDEEASEMAAGTWTSRRLTKEQYAHTVADTLGVTLGAQLDLLPDEARIEGFTNSAVGLVVTADHVDAYFELAEWISSNVDTSALGAAHASCQTLGDATCEEGFVRSFASDMFRRPASDAEIASLSALFDTASSEGLGFADGVALVIEAVLQSPQFLYLLEDETLDDDTRTVVGYEMASRLSYLLWQSAPDAALYEAAAAGELDTQDGVLAHAEAMLEGDHSARATSRFVRDWFDLDALAGTERADLSGDMALELLDASVQTYQAHVAEGLPLWGVFASNTVYLPEFAAEWYGLAAQSGIAAYDISGLAERSGLLTHPGPMTTISDRDIGGLVARGLFVMEHLMCKHPLSPPPDLNLTDFTSHLGPDATERDYSIDRLANDACSVCHGQFDPLSYAFERFDGIGRYALQDELGNELRADGEHDGQPFATPAEYVSLLSEDPDVQRCVTKKHLMFALGARGDALGDAVDQVHARFVDGGGSYEAMIRAIVGHHVFRVVLDGGTP